MKEDYATYNSTIGQGRSIQVDRDGDLFIETDALNFDCIYIGLTDEDRLSLARDLMDAVSGREDK